MYRMLAIDLDHLVPEIEIGSVEPAQRGDIGIHPGFPLAPLNDHHRVRNPEPGSRAYRLRDQDSVAARAHRHALG